MRKCLIIFILLVVGSSFIWGQSSGIGVGLSTIGLSGKYWLSAENAISVNLSSTISADYLINDPDRFKFAEAPTPFYYGGGVYLGAHTQSNDDSEKVTKIDLGVRAVVGLGYYLPSAPIDVYIEMVPSLALLGGGGFGLDQGTLGLRYFF